MAGNGADLWLGEPVDHWRRRWGVPVLEIHPCVGSTNDRVRQLADAGAPEGTTVLADEQTSGRGRRGRAWVAPAGSSLLLSMLFRPARPGLEAILSIRLGIAAAAAIEEVAPVRVELKWPNDLFSGDRKVGGILCEGHGEPGRGLFLVAGIGVNIAQQEEDWPADLRNEATALEQRAGAPVDRGRLAGHLIAAWRDAARRDAPALEPDEIREFRRRDLLYGLEITVDGTPAGVGRGIDPDGALRAGVSGAPRRVIAGTVRSRAPLTPEQP